MTKLHLLSKLTALAIAFTIHGQATAQQLPNHAVALLYHHVDNNSPDITSVSPDQFEEQLDYLAKHDFQVWPLDKIVSALRNGEKLPENIVAITFDDSYLSVYKEAYPRLKKRNWPFTIFASTDPIDQNYNFQTSWDQLREMAANGATIANHSKKHLHLLKRLPDETKRQWRQRIEMDIKHTQDRINAEIKTNSKLFAYPYGEYNQDLENIIEDMGYIGFGQHSGPIGEASDWQALPRFPIAGRYSDISDFSLKLMTIPMPVKKITTDQNPLKNSIKQPEIILTFAEVFDLQNIQCFASNQGKINTKIVSSNQLKISPNNDIPAGRSRYNCTLLLPDQKKQKNKQQINSIFYWFSHPWIRLNQQNQWPPE